MLIIIDLNLVLSEEQFSQIVSNTKKNKIDIRQTLELLESTTTLISYLRESQNRSKNRVFELIFEVSRVKIPLFILNLPFPTHQGALGRIK